MLGDLGNVFTGLALLSTVYAAIAAFISTQSADKRWWESARNALHGATAMLFMALLTLTVAFLTDAFEIRYVAQNSSSLLPLYLKLSAVWAGQEGSLLLWSAFQALFTSIAIAKPNKQTLPMLPWAMVILGLIGTFFIGVTLLLSNPFAPTGVLVADGQGLNPLLRHPGMIFHPPAMYVGYVGLAVPFAFALAALLSDQVESWTSAMRTWTLVAWIGLSLGLLLGMRWAYDVLGWGGYWGWDPVENAGLMPWLTATALLHGAVMQDERRGFRAWNYILVTLSFVLVLFGTFATRSGMIQSVHAYAQSPLGIYFLVAIFISLAASLGLMLAFRSRLQTVSHDESLLSRDGLFFLTLVLFCVLTLSVFIGSVLPSITGALGGQQFEAGSEWFDRVTGPQFAALVLLIGVCPLVGRSVKALLRLRKYAWVGAIGVVLSIVIALLTGFTGWESLVGFALTGLALATVVLEFVTGAAQRISHSEQPPLNVIWMMMRQQRRKYGGYLVHLGIVLMAMGVIGTRMYPFEQDVVLSVGESKTIGSYSVTLEQLDRDILDDRTSTFAAVSVYQNDQYIATLLPRIDQYLNYDQMFAVPALKPGLREDVYMILGGWGANGSSATLKFVVNSLANFLWAGGLVFLTGGALALFPQGRKSTGQWVYASVVALLLLGAGWAMWGAPHGIETSGERLHIGSPAPDMRIPLLDGSVLTSNDIAGQVTVINFWASWCPTCEENMPVLVAAANMYNDGVTFVGIAYQTDVAEATAKVETHQIPYAIGIDAGDRLAELFFITGVPETYIIDADGRVAFIHIGPVNREQLIRELDLLLGR